MPQVDESQARRKKSSKESLPSKSEILGGSADPQQNEPIMATVSGRGLISTSEHVRSNYR